MDPLPERVELVAAPGALRDQVLEVLGWRTEDGEVALTCRLIDGSAGTIPARWTDLPRGGAVECALGVVATPAAWRLLCERLDGLRKRRPMRARASGENGGRDVGTARASNERSADRAAVGAPRGGRAR